jgi:hypothetical protein
MDKQSVNSSAIQFVDNLIQTHDWTDTTDAIYSYKESCKHLDICQEKLRGRQKNLKKNSLHSKQIPQKVAQIFPQSQQSQRSNHTTNAQMEQVTHPSSYVSNRIHKRRIQRHLRHKIITDTYALNLRQLRQLPRQNTTDPFANQLFNGTSFY